MAESLGLSSAVARQMRLAGASQKMINKVRRGLQAPKEPIKIDKKFLKRIEHVLTANGVVVVTKKRAFTLSGYMEQVKHGHGSGRAALVIARGAQATKRAAAANDEHHGSAPVAQKHAHQTPADVQSAMAHKAH